MVEIGIEFTKIWVVVSGMAVSKEGRGVVLGTIKVDVGSSVDNSESVEIELEESEGRSNGVHWSELGNDGSVVPIPSSVVQSTTSI